MLMEKLTANAILKKFYDGNFYQIKTLIDNQQINVFELDKDEIELELDNLWFNPFIHIGRMYRKEIFSIVFLFLFSLTLLSYSISLMVNGNFAPRFIGLTAVMAMISISFLFFCYIKLKESYNDFIYRKDEIRILVKPVELRTSPLV